MNLLLNLMCKCNNRLFFNMTFFMHCMQNCEAHSLAFCRWSYGVLLFEIVTLGGSPYPGVQPHDMEVFLESGQRMEQPESCPYEL